MPGLPRVPNYRRIYVPGGTYFFTVVTHARAALLTEDALPHLRRAIHECRQTLPFRVDAMVVLPDHLHAIWTLPPGDSDFSKRWGLIKKHFTRSWIAGGGREGRVSLAQRRKRRRGVWQGGFWEHVVRDDEELAKLVDYIHYNPVKHGYVRCPHEWRATSFHRFVREGRMTRDWACVCDSRPTDGGFRFDEIMEAVGE